MTEAAKAARAAYMREWRAKNPDKWKDYAERSWERKAAALAASAKGAKNGRKKAAQD